MLAPGITFLWTNQQLSFSLAHFFRSTLARITNHRVLIQRINKSQNGSYFLTRVGTHGKEMECVEFVVALAMVVDSSAPLGSWELVGHVE
jgi:predicted deacylase